MNKKIRYLVLASLAMLLSLAGFGQDNARQLNIILITADDLGTQLGCYGDNIIKTPNIDKLASRGIIFTDGYVTQASCSSSRSSILTGTFPHYNGQIGLAHRGFELNQYYDNLPGLLKNAGYKTGILGKLHVNPENFFPFDYANKNYQEARNVELVAERAINFIQSAADSAFFLYINYTDPHVPFFKNYEGHPRSPVESQEVQAFKWQGVNDSLELERISGYYSCVRRLDEGIGLLMNGLQQLNVLDNTLIFFIGDHGAPFDRGKGACYESSVKIPFIVIDPTAENLPPASGALVSTADILPTILDKLNLSIPATVQGRSLAPILENKRDKVREFLFTEFNHHTKTLSSFYPRRTIRDAEYKLILNLRAPEVENEIIGMDGDHAYKLSQTEKYNGTWVRDIFDRFKAPPVYELYNLKEDPFEKQNLAGLKKHRAVEKKLKSVLEKWLQNTNDPFIEEGFLRKYVADLKANEDEN